MAALTRAVAAILLGGFIASCRSESDDSLASGSAPSGSLAIYAEMILAWKDTGAVIVVTDSGGRTDSAHVNPEGRIVFHGLAPGLATVTTRYQTYEPNVVIVPDSTVNVRVQTKPPYRPPGIFK